MTDLTDDARAHRLKKLKFRASRRGFVEADLILGAFAAAELDGMSDTELDTFEALLEEPDQPLYAWIIGTEATPPAFDHEIMARIRAHLPNTFRSVQGLAVQDRADPERG
jgi:antitoxin CptB